MAALTGGRFKELLKKYGKVAIGVHCSVSAASITGLFIAIKNNVDVEAVIDKLHLPGLSSKPEDDKPPSNSNSTDTFVTTIQENPDFKDGFSQTGSNDTSSTSIEKKKSRTAELAASTGGALALAVLCNKALFPIRVPMTIALTPAVARFLARRRIMKTGGKKW